MNLSLTTGSRGKSLERRDRRIGIWFLVPALAILIAIVAYPFFYSVAMSGMRWRPTELGRPFVGLYNYVQLFTDDRFFIALRNTFIYGIGGAIGKLFVGMLLALLLNQRFPGRGVARTLLMLPWVIPFSASITTWRWMYDGMYGIYNIILERLHIISQPINWLGQPVTALLACLVVGIWVGYPLFMVMILAGLQAIPDELHEAARVEGASAFQRFLYVTIPGLRTILTIAFILSVIWSFNAFNVIWLMTQGGPSDATHIFNTLAYEFAFTDLRYGYAAALGIVTMILLAVFLFFFAKLQRED